MTLTLLTIIKAIILGIVEGVTEFLPISSTGHLILVNQFISFDQSFTVLFDIVIQLGAILAVLFYFRKKLWPFSTDSTKNKDTFTIWRKTIVGVLPAIILGALLASLIEEKLFIPGVVATALIVGGLIILFIERKDEQPAKINSLNDLSFKTVFLIGVVQCLAMIPGVSRSAATIVGGMVFGASRVVATEFSFFLAIPTMLAASTYSLIKHQELLTIDRTPILLIGLLTSFMVALAVIKFLLNFIQTNNFKIFGYYRIVLGLIIIGFFVLA